MTNKDFTAATKQRYDRIAGVYNIMESMMNSRLLNKYRQELFTQITGPQVLEVGVGTGVNLPFYPKDVELTAIDLSPKMLSYARKRAERLELDVELRLMDVQSLNFPDDSFDTVITTCVFCSVPDPLQGLREINRVLKPDGYLLMLEHVLSERPIAKLIMEMLNPIVVHTMGANINRRTRQNLERAGFSVSERAVWSDIVKIFHATSST